VTTQRRRELDQTLPEASQYLCKYLWQMCQEGGVQISTQDLLFLGRSVTDYIRNTEQGKFTVFKILKTDFKPASNLKSYFQEGYLGDDARKINPQDLLEYHGYIFKRQHAIPYHSVDVDDREDNDVCDSCGTRTPVGYCLKPVEVLAKDGRFKVENRCNHCRFNSEQTSVRATGSSKTCDLCEKTTCEFHPKFVEKGVASPKQLSLTGKTADPQTILW
jgi:hypothetical protein